VFNVEDSFLVRHCIKSLMHLCSCFLMSRKDLVTFIPKITRIKIKIRFCLKKRTKKKKPIFILFFKLSTLFFFKLEM